MKVEIIEFPNSDYAIREKSFWKSTKYVSLTGSMMRHSKPYNICRSKNLEQVCILFRELIGGSDVLISCEI